MQRQARVAAQQSQTSVEGPSVVFLAWTTSDIAEERKRIAEMLRKSGIKVLPEGDEPPKDKEALKEQIQKAIEEADFSLHLLGGEYGEEFEAGATLNQYQYALASQKAKQSKGKFFRFVWAVPVRFLQGEQQEFITEIQNTLSRAIYFTATENPTQLIEDIRSYLAARKEEEEVLKKEYALTFISNIIDASSSYEIGERLIERYNAQTLTIEPQGGVDYREEAAKLIRKSKLAVIYFKEASEWAVAFTQLIWKYVKGASAQTAFLLIGEDTPARNRFIRFKAPMLKLEIVPHESVLETITKYMEKVQKGEPITTETFCPYTGLRPFKEEEAIFFRGRDEHIDAILKILQEKRFVMVTGASGDGKSSLIYAGVIPSIKAGFLPSMYSNWIVADMKPERAPLYNLAKTLTEKLHLGDVDEVMNQLSYGFSALVELYKKSEFYCDVTSEAYLNADEQQRKQMLKRAANLLILVDQFEEFFTNKENFRDGVASPLAQITVNVLLETIKIAQQEGLPIYVVFTMRSDYIGQCVAFRGLAEMIGHSSYFIPRLKREEIQQVIEEPAIFNGDEIEMRLVQRLLNDAGDGTDQLPVLQHALHQIWSLAKAEGSAMDLIHYAKVGGLSPNRLPKEDRILFQQWFEQLPEYKKALYDRPKLRNVLNRHANELYETAAHYYQSRYGEEIDPEDAKFIVQQAFIALTKIDENRAVRNRATLEEITQIIGREDIDHEKVCKVLNCFREEGNTFLQPFLSDSEEILPPSTVLDITHEALIRNWELLGEWAQEEYKSAQIFQEFRVQLDNWLDSEKSPEYLLSIGPYTYFNDWFEEQQPTPAWILRYLDPKELDPEIDPLEQAEYYLEDAIEFLEESRKQIERKRRLLLLLLGLISFLLLLSLITAFFAWQQRNEALRQKQIALQQARIAEQQRLLAEMHAREAENQRLKAERARLLAEQQRLIAENQRRKAEAERLNAIIQQKIAENERRLAEYQRKIAENQRIIAENQRRLAVAAEKAAKESEAEALLQAEIARMERNNALILQSLFLASLSQQQTLKSNPEIAMLLALEGLPKTLRNPDRPYVEETEAALYYALNAIINKRPYKRLIGHKNKVVHNQFSPDGKHLISTSWDKTARVWDVTTEQTEHLLKGHRHIVDKAAFSEDGQWLLTVASDFSARLWNLKEGTLQAIFKGHEDLITHAALNFDVSRVVTASKDHTLRLYEAQTGRLINILEGHEGAVTYATFSHDGRYIASASEDNTVRIWDGKEGRLIATLQGHQAPVLYVAFSPDDRYLVSTSKDKTAIVWDVQRAKKIHVLRGHQAAVLHAAFSPNGKWIATASEDSTAKVWSLRDGKLLGTLKEHKAAVYHVQFSPDERFILTSSDDKTLRLWDAEYFVRFAIFYDNPGRPYHGAFSPDGKYLAAAGKYHKIVIYKLLPTRQALLDLAHKLKKRDLTPEERKRFFLADERVRHEIIEEQLRLRKLRGRRDYLKEVELLPVPPEPEPPELLPVPNIRRRTNQP